MAILALIRHKRRQRKRRVRTSQFESLELRNMPAALVDVGHHMVEPDAPGQTVSISVVNNDIKSSLVSSFDLRAQIVTEEHGPVFDGVRFAGSLWNTFPHIESGGPNPSDPTTASGQVAFTPGFTAAADGTLVTLSIDTTGIPAGSYEFRLVGTKLGDSSFIGEGGSVVGQNIANGTLQVRSIWQNPNDVGDVNDDGYVTPIDPLLVIHKLNKTGSKKLPMPTSGDAPPPFYDVNGDGFISPLDVLKLVNCFNGTGCESSPAPIMASVTPDFEPEPDVSVGTGSGGVTVPSETGEPSDPEPLPPDHEECEQVSSEDGGTIVPDPDSPICVEEILDPEPEPIEEEDKEPEFLPDPDTHSISGTTEFAGFSRLIIGTIEQSTELKTVEQVFANDDSEELVDLGLSDVINSFG